MAAGYGEWLGEVCSGWRGAGDGGGLEDGEAGLELPSEGWQNSLMVTVSRLVVTSVTTTLAQRGAISGRQSGSPSTGTLPSASVATLTVPTISRGVELLLSGLLLQTSWGQLRPFLCVVASSLSSSTRDETDEDDWEDADEEDDSEGEQVRKLDDSGSAPTIPGVPTLPIGGS